MQDMGQQLFNFYFRGGWLWLALVPLLLFILILIDNQRRQRQALSWIVFLAGCLCVFVPSFFYSLSDGHVLTQATHEIFYAGLLGTMGAVLGLIGYVVSFQGRLPHPGPGSLAYIYPQDSRVSDGETRFEDDPVTEGIDPIFTSNHVKITPPLQSSAFLSSASMPPEKREYAPGWLQDRAGRQYRLLKNITHVGREDDQDIRFTELTVSRRHALIRHERYGRVDVFVLEAIGKGETALNGVILGKDANQLYDGDRIRLGTVELTFFTQAGR